MYKYTINYKDFDGTNKTRNLYFHLTTSELLDLEFVKGYKIAQKVQEIMDGTKSDNPTIKEQGNKASYMLFKDIIEAAYGEKSSDGNFVKRSLEGVPLYLSFETTEAYSEFFMTLLTDGDLAGKFLSEVIPSQSIQNFADRVQKNNSGYNTTGINNQINNQLGNNSVF